MDPESYKEARELFHELIGLTPEERGRALAELRVDPELRATLDALLESADDDEESEAESAAVRERLMDSAPTTRIVRIGRFEITGELGVGGMGVVYAGRDTDSGRQAAIKVVRGELESESLLRRFRREGRLLEQFDHPGIARFLDAGEASVVSSDGGRTRMWHLAMERVQGTRIDHHVAEQKLGVRERVELIAQVSEALAHAHAHGVVHRDLKPQNLLVEPGKEGEVGTAKVLDFGIARDTTTRTMSVSLTSHGDVMGTIRYMSPEQVVGGAKGLDERSDVYSLGLVLFELLTDRLPYELGTQSLPEAARVIAEREPARLGQVDTRFNGSPLEIVLARALAKTRAYRYRDMEAFGADLRRYLRGESLAVKKLPLTYRVSSFVRQHRVLSGAMAALFVGAIVSAWFAIQMAIAKGRADRVAYVASLAAAEAALSNADVAVAAEQLERAPESLRGWEWRHLHSRLDDSVALHRCGRALNDSLEFSADGERLYLIEAESGGSSSLVTIELEPDGFGEATRRELEGVGLKVLDGGCLIEHLPRIRSTPLESEGNVAAGVLTITPFEGVDPSWDEWGIVREAPSGAPFAAIAPDGRVRIGQHGEARAEPVPYSDNPVAIGPDGKWLAIVGTNGALRWWPLAPGAEPVTLQDDPSAGVLSLAITRTGDVLASGGEGGSLALWNVGDDAPAGPRSLRGHRAAIWALAFSSDGKYLISGGDDRAVRVWLVETGELLQEFRGHRGAVFSVAIDSTSTRIASQAAKELRLWEFRRDDLRELRRSTPVSVVLGPNGNRVVWCDRAGTLGVFDESTRSRVVELDCAGDADRPLARTVAAGGRWIAVASSSREGRFQVFDAITGESVEALVGEGTDVERRTVDLTRDGSLLATSESPGSLRAWDTATWRELASAPQNGAALVAFDPAGSLLASAGEEGSILLRDPRDLSVVRELAGHTDGLRRAAFRADGSLLATTGADGVVCVWTVSSGALRSRIELPSRDALSVAFAPDGERLVIGCFDGAIRMWSLAGERALVVLPGHSDWVGSLVFSNDGRTLYSGSADGGLRAWSTEPLAAVLARGRSEADSRGVLGAQVDSWLETLDRAEVVARISTHEVWSERERELALQALLGR